MPIRVTCQCGQNLNVPDAAAGKWVKCPKCQQKVQVPGAASPSPAPPTPAATAKQAKAAAVPQPAATGNLAGLFDQAGLTQRSGKFCPSCDAAVPAGAVICVKCGLHFEEGSKLEGYALQAKGEFGNKQLNQAVEMMAREKETEKRLLNAGTPWWLMLAGLTGIVVFIGGALIKMDAYTTGQVSGNAFMARIQNADIGSVLAASAGFGLLLISIFAYLAILVDSYFESTKQGLLSTFAPFYITYYMFSRISTRKLWSTVIIMWVTGILSGIALGFALPRI